MSSDADAGAVDILLRWKEGDGAAPDPSTDRLEVEAALADAEPEAAAAPPPVPDVDPPAVLGEEAPPHDAEGPEFFEWSADREKALEEALRDAPEGATPGVQRQLDALRQALEGSRLDVERARFLLAEVDGWLHARLADEAARVPVAHGGIVGARDDRRRALEAWQESTAALRAFLDGGDPVQLQVAAYAADQGAAFLAGARRAVFDAQPEHA